MRRAARKDANHPEVVQAFRDLGCSVLDLARMGEGCPDLLVWIPSRVKMTLVEVKNGAKAPSARKLTPDQEKFFKAWHGPVVVVTSVEDVYALCGARRTA